MDNSIFSMDNLFFGDFFPFTCRERPAKRSEVLFFKNREFIPLILNDK
ncbi:hypothetical protein MTsPCn9_11430 [Croceitalea sp. MTPC9]|nr:hypothetical protein MTsPCn6_32210 [Croceitalea sp. MTPC6]GMN16207.1 hypothetical protein MTsPCn9_11430 [Croceitalea sp. MTPC9]